ncbi:hypothetical protein HYT05_03760 [Candidatus Kaiserbacteria bacterium]|nr:hypothetical protein [Candidatus Kaiserbacteria bacterium]
MSPTPGHHNKRSLFGTKKRNLKDEREDAKRWMIVSCVIALCGVIGMVMGNRTPSLPVDLAGYIFNGGVAVLILGMVILLWEVFKLSEMDADNK